MAKTNHSEQARLKEYLNRYYWYQRRKTLLEERLKKILHDLRSPLSTAGYSEVAGQKGISDKTAGLAVRKLEAEERILENMAAMEKQIVNIMDILELLEETSFERIVLEQRYLDCKNWERLSADICLSRSACFVYHNNGIKKLLEQEPVKALLKEYREGE